MSEPVWYRIDPEGTILEVGGGWDAFARENDAADLASEAVGRSLWSYVENSFTRDVYERLLERVGDRGRVTFDYRCDAPGLRRKLRMTIEEEPSGTVRFSNELIRAEPREPVEMLRPGIERTDEIDLTVCGWCKRGRRGDAWVELEEFVADGLFTTSPFPVVTHGICPGCEARILGEDDAA